MGAQTVTLRLRDRGSWKRSGDPAQDLQCDITDRVTIGCSSCRSEPANGLQLGGGPCTEPCALILTPLSHQQMCFQGPHFPDPTPRSTRDTCAEMSQLGTASGRETAQPLNARQAVIPYVDTAHVELLCHLLPTALGKKCLPTPKRLTSWCIRNANAKQHLIGPKLLKAWINLLM